MLNSLKKFSLVATVLGGTLFAWGCLPYSGKGLFTILAILTEDFMG